MRPWEPDVRDQGVRVSGVTAMDRSMRRHLVPFYQMLLGLGCFCGTPLYSMGILACSTTIIFPL
jgi:hypothetical protein